MISSDEGLEALFTMESERGAVIEEPSFRLLILADLSGDGTKKDVSSRRPIEIDRDNFDEVLSRIAPKLSVVHGETAAPLELTFKVLDDFHPDNIFASVPLFAELRDLRRRLKNEDSFFEAAREVRSLFSEPANEMQESAPKAADVSAPGGDGDDLLSQILARPTGGAASTRPKAAGSSELNYLIGELVRPHLVRVDEDERSQMLAAVDDATSGLMRAIIHDHRFQALEAAWRGLYFLVRRVETDVDLKIFVLDISKEELAGDLRSSDDLSKTRTFELLVTEAVETPGGEPWAAVFGDYGFLPAVDDIAALVRLSKIASAAGAPFISHMRPDVLGIHSLEGNTDPRTWTLDRDTEALKLWSALRSIGEAEYLGMTIPRFLARLPYGADTEPLESFSFEEFPDAPEHDKYLWANSSYACAALLAQTFSAAGWQMDKRFAQDLDRLPVHVYESSGETVYVPCAEVQLTHDGCDRLMEFGLMPLVSFKNTDHVKLARFQSVADPVTGLRGRWKT
jgi:type VI secretion system protein ImpC